MGQSLISNPSNNIMALWAEKMPAFDAFSHRVYIGVIKNFFLFFKTEVHMLLQCNPPPLHTPTPF